MSAPCATSPVKFQLRRDTSTNWTASTSILGPGEPGIELDTGQMKIGNGSSTWNSLPYVGSAFYTKYLLDPPPAPLGLTIDSSHASQYINVYWQYPTQINAGFYSTGWLPNITSFSAQLEGVTYNSLANQTVTLTTTNARFVDLHNGSNPIVLLQLTPFSGTNQLSNVTVGSTVYQGWTICDTNLASMTDGAGLIRVYYNNCNTTSTLSTYSSTASPITFNLAKGPPELPTNLAAADVSGPVFSSGRILEAITFTKSTYANSLNHLDTTAIVSTYQYTYVLQSTSSRYGTALTHSSSASISGTLNSNNTYLNPGSVYLISLTATNSYSLTSTPTVTLTTNQTGFPTVPSATAFSMTSRYYPNAIMISNASSVGNLLSNYTSWSTASSFISTIHTGVNRGSTSSTLSSNVYSITGAALAGSPGFPTVTFNGFGVTPTNVKSGTSNVVNPTVTVVDSYADAPSQGFYLVGSNTFTVDLTQTTYFKNSYSLYTLSATGIPSSTTFYYDNISASSIVVTPTISLGTNTTTSVSGLTVYGSTEYFSNQLICTNMGDYFCAPVLAQCRVKLVDAFDSTTAYGSYSNLTIANVSSTISAGTFYYGSTLGSAKILYSDSESLDTYAVAAVSINGVASNLISTTAFDSDPSSVLKIVIDQPSITLLAALPSSLTSVGTSSTYVDGRLVSSAGDCNTTTYVPAAWYSSTSVTSYGAVAYDHTALLTATGNHELMLARGKFRTRGTSGYYRDFSVYGGNPNYSGIAYASSDFRFITFAWKVAGSDTGGNGVNFGHIGFTLSNVAANTFSFNALNGRAYFTGTSVYPSIFYRLEQQYTTGADYRIPVGSTTLPGGSNNYTSDWNDMNLINASNVNATNYNDLTSTKATTPYVKSGFGGVTSNTNGDGTMNYVFTPLFPRAADVITATTYLYCRVAMPMDLDFQFTNVSATMY